MDEQSWLITKNLLLLLSRYLHIVCTTLLVGGTLFFEMVVPVAIGELRQEQQLAVFARARWVFRRIVWISALFIMTTGVVSTMNHWQAYTEAESPVSRVSNLVPASTAPFAKRPGWWWVAHASCGTLAVVIALFLTSGKSPPERPIGWMRLNLVILMVVIFLGSAARQVRSLTDTREGKFASPISETDEP